ncbi:unnamed protein product [Meloidogyne enterolobii]|uniref:Uncharacterized protein n=1 Tax=Meloidogyne enterolobii TaxID=390850 RepID=A0ACB1ATC6_MELEN
MAGQNNEDDAQLENLKAIKEINDRLCNVENKTNEQDEIITLQEQRLIILEEQEKKLRNKQKKKSSWLGSLTNFVGEVIDTGKSYVGKIFENVTTPIIEKPKVEEVPVDSKEGNIEPDRPLFSSPIFPLYFCKMVRFFPFHSNYLSNFCIQSNKKDYLILYKYKYIPRLRGRTWSVEVLAGGSFEKKEDLAEEFAKIGNDLTSKNTIEFNKIEIFFEEKGEKLQNFREVNKLGEVNKEKKENINLTTIPNNQNNGEVPSLSNNNGQSSSNSDNNGGDVDPKNKESKIKDSQEPVNDKNNREVPNLSNNNGQPSSSNPDDNGGDNPKNNEYESQIKDLQETVTRQNIEYSRLLNELKRRISLQERKVLEKEEIIKQNQEKIEKREEEIAKLQREKNSVEENKNAIEEQKRKLEELNNKLEEEKNKSEGKTLGKIVVGVAATTGAVIGGVVGGPFGAVVGGAAGAVIEVVVGVVKSAFKAVKSFFGWFCS